ncbi:hypothetical protein [Stenotrophomonas sp. NA06056]|uniref:hypothetical protein n=1 Tax=Stenotrophomonas sp. NA06056 TaxID=2742129 RepID=UPI0015885649|nr:hypothetical protein [Stenotrophomonas sp. NA06056]QKW55881.1 hypothetical protein HUT07_04315 [Stenotrophomonas sp. NA06056]
MFKAWNDAIIPALARIRDSPLQAVIDQRLSLFSQAIGAKRIRLIPHPLVFDRDEYDRITAGALHILSAQAKLVAALRARQSAGEMMQRLGLPAAWEKYVDWTQLASGQHRVVRVDLIASASGHHICEFNFSAAVGGGELHDYYRVFADVIGFPRSECDISPFENLGCLYQATQVRQPFENLVLLDWSSHAALGYPNPSLCRQQLMRSLPGVDIQIHDELSLATAWAARSDLSDALIHRCFTYDDVTANATLYDDLVERGARFSNGLEAELLMSKGWLALLWDTAHHALFNPEEIAAIKTFLLQSWEVRAEDRQWMLAEKDRLIFKQKNSYGGSGIVPGGSLTGEALWQELQQAGLDSWIAQRFADSPEVVHAVDNDGASAAHRQVLGLYLHGQRPSGIVVRSARGSSVVNAGSGACAGWAPVLTADERESLSDRLHSMR